MDRAIVIARNATEMAVAQKQLVSWALTKEKEVMSEVRDIRDNYNAAVKNKWRTETLARLLKSRGKEATFYKKARLALEAGYIIVPNFDAEVFAVRTTLKQPRKNTTINANPNSQLSTQSPPGEGTYVSPYTVDHEEDITKPDDKNSRIRRWAEEFKAVSFPFNLVKTEIFTSTQEAMDAGVFDEIVACPKFSRHPRDPMILGRIIHGGQRWYRPNMLTFLIAWYVDTKDL